MSAGSPYPSDSSQKLSSGPPLVGPGRSPITSPASSRMSESPSFTAKAMAMPGSASPIAAVSMSQICFRISGVARCEAAAPSASIATAMPISSKMLEATSTSGASGGRPTPALSTACVSADSRESLASVHSLASSDVCSRITIEPPGLARPKQRLASGRSEAW